MSQEEKTFQVSLTRGEGFGFHVDFQLEGVEGLEMDEPQPVGRGNGPNASRVLAAAVGNCLAASLLFCLEKSRVPVGSLEARVEGTMRRNEAGRWRIVELNVELRPELDVKEYEKQFQRCLDLYRDFCIISSSIEQGIPIRVSVNPS